jgi:hypothetical protein
MRKFSGMLFLPDNLFCLELGPDLFRIVFSNLSGMHEICIDFWRDSRILVNKSVLKLDLQDFCAVIISYRAKNAGFHGQSFHGYHHTLTRALTG